MNFRHPRSKTCRWQAESVTPARCRSLTLMNSTQPATHRSPGTRRISMTVLLLTALLAFGVHTALAAQPAVGQKAPDFTLSTPEGVAIHFSDLTGQGDVVLVLLRGYPGYQCPYCQKQVHDFVANDDKFAQAQAQVLLV